MSEYRETRADAKLCQHVKLLRRPPGALNPSMDHCQRHMCRIYVILRLFRLSISGQVHPCRPHTYCKSCALKIKYELGLRQRCSSPYSARNWLGNEMEAEHPSVSAVALCSATVKTFLAVLRIIRARYAKKPQWDAKQAGKSSKRIH